MTAVVGGFGTGPGGGGGTFGRGSSAALVPAWLPSGRAESASGMGTSPSSSLSRGTSSTVSMSVMVEGCASSEMTGLPTNVVCFDSLSRSPPTVEWSWVLVPETRFPFRTGPCNEGGICWLGSFSERWVLLPEGCSDGVAVLRLAVAGRAGIFSSLWFGTGGSVSRPLALSGTPQQPKRASRPPFFFLRDGAPGEFGSELPGVAVGPVAAPKRLLVALPLW